MTRNQRKLKCLVREARELFAIAVNLKLESDALARKACELREAMRMSQSRVRQTEEIALVRCGFRIGP